MDKWDERAAELLPDLHSYLVNYRPAVAAELRRMGTEAELWKEEARRHSDNASFWCKKAAGM